MSIDQLRTDIICGTGLSILVIVSLCACWGMMLSAVITLFVEQLEKSRGFSLRAAHRRAIDLFCVLLCMPWVFLLRGGLRMEYFGTLLALFLLFMHLVCSHLSLSRLIISSFLTSVVLSCISMGSTLIVVAFETLLHEFSSSSIYTVTGFIIPSFLYVNLLLAWLAAPAELDGTGFLPKMFKVVFLYVLFPLYAALVLVLYGYLVKSLAMRVMPEGKINPFVSAATAGYFLFYFTLSSYQGRAVRLFYRAGHFVMLALIVLQCVAFGIRIQSYGFTSVRYASLLYIILSASFCIVAAIRSGRYMKWFFCAAAALTLLACLTPLNVTAVPLYSQRMRIERIFKAHGLFRDGLLVTDGAEKELSMAEKKKLSGAFAYLKEASESKSLIPVKVPRWMETGKTDGSYDFAKVFGFEQPLSASEDEEESFHIDAEDTEIDISGFSTFRQVDIVESNKNDTVKVTFEASGRTYDITKDVLRLRNAHSDGFVEKEPCRIVLEDGAVLVLTRLYVRVYADSKKTDCWGRGFLLK